MKISKEKLAKRLLILLFVCLVGCIASVSLGAALSFIGICIFSVALAWCINVLIDVD